MLDPEASAAGVLGPSWKPGMPPTTTTPKRDKPHGAFSIGTSTQPSPSSWRQSCPTVLQPPFEELEERLPMRRRRWKILEMRKHALQHASQKQSHVSHMDDVASSGSKLQKDAQSCLSYRKGSGSVDQTGVRCGAMT